ncbi:MAG: cache domain-containing protein [Eubacteriales bacterium]
MFKDNSIVKVIYRNTVTLIIITVVLFGYLWGSNIKNIYDSEINQVEKDVTTRAQAVMVNEIDRIIDLIERKSQEKEKILKTSIESRTNEAYSTAENIYQKNKDKYTEEDIKELIKEALRPIRYNNDRGYFFIVSLDGTEILYPVYPEFEGQNVLELKDDLGNYVIKNEIKKVKESREGFVEGYWKKPDSDNDKLYQKISFVKKFEPYNWYIGTGEYLLNVENDIQKEILKEINERRYGNNKELYLFATSYEGIEIANGMFGELIGRNIKDLENINGEYVFEEELRTVKNNPEGDFIYHSWYDEENNNNLERETMVFVRPYEDWNWIIGTSMYTDQFDAIKVKLSEELKKETTEQVLKALIATILILIIALIVLGRSIIHISKSLEAFQDFFESAVQKHKQLDISSIKYNEFKQTALLANQMINETKNIENKLKKISVTDSLTKLYNRKYIYEVLRSSTEEYIENLSIIMFDIDDFKNINDTYGHNKGDEVLVKISEISKDNVRSTDTISRYGGEEFLIVLPNTSLDTAYDISERIRKSISKISIDEIENITVSLGLTKYKSFEPISDFINRADKAMYKAKELGKNRTEII